MSEQPETQATVDEDVSWADMPNLRKVGRYLFFAACSFGLGGLVYIITRKIGFTGDMAGSANSVASVVSFFALRDMSKQWDWALEKRADARRAQRTVRDALTGEER